MLQSAYAESAEAIKRVDSSCKILPLTMICQWSRAIIIKNIANIVLWTNLFLNIDRYHMPESLATYQSYVLRIWQDSPHTPWRCSAQCIQTKEIIHFADLGSFFLFLAIQTTTLPPAEYCQRH